MQDFCDFSSDRLIKCLVLYYPNPEISANCNAEIRLPQSLPPLLVHLVNIKSLLPYEYTFFSLPTELNLCMPSSAKAKA